MANTNSTVPNPQELEIPTAENWLEQGTIWIDEIDNEKTYYKDQFAREYYCKNYPQQPEPVDVPEWITEPLSPADIAAILQGGCESGAWMPAGLVWLCITFPERPRHGAQSANTQSEGRE